MIIAIQPGEIPILERLGVPSEKIRIIPNGVEEAAFHGTGSERFQAKYGKDGQIILYVGKIHETKGIHCLIKAFKFVDKRMSDVPRLFVVGEGRPKYAAYLKRLVEKLNLTEKVVFTGFLPEDEKQQALASCSFLVLPSLYEPFGIVLLEAMAQGKPVVATRAGGPRHLVSDGKNGLLVRSNDPDDLARAMIELLENNSLRQEIGVYAKSFTKNYTWTAIAGEIESLYKMLIQKRNG